MFLQLYFEVWVLPENNC